MKRYLVNCKDYNGNKNVLFMMDKKDSRLSYEAAYNMYKHKGDEFAKKTALETIADYEIIAECDYKKKVLTTPEGIQYDVFSDWSVRKVA